MMPWTAPTHRHPGAKVVVFVNHGDPAAAMEDQNPPVGLEYLALANSS